MKKIIKRIVNSIGYNIIRDKEPLLEATPVQKKSVKTDRLKLHETVTGNYYLPEDAIEDHVANTIINNQIFDKEVIDCASLFIRHGTVVLDVGANFGQMSILFSRMTGDGGKVFSFDADDFIFEILKKNIQVNDRKNIEAVFGAVHNTPNQILIFPEQDFERFGAYGSYGIDYTQKKEGRKVPTITIDDLNIAGEISFMKVDVQGGDLYAMQGAVKTIAKHKMPILFEFEYLFQDEMHLDFQEYVDFVKSIDYKFERVINGQNYLILPKKII